MNFVSKIYRDAKTFFGVFVSDIKFLKVRSGVPAQLKSGAINEVERVDLKRRQLASALRKVEIAETLARRIRILLCLGTPIVLPAMFFLSLVWFAAAYFRAVPSLPFGLGGVVAILIGIRLALCFGDRLFR